MKTAPLLRALCAMSLAFSSTVMAAPYPDRPVRIVVPQTPGGGNDTVARIIADKLSQRWKQSLVIENRAAAVGNIGTDMWRAHPPTVTRSWWRATGQWRSIPRCTARSGTASRTSTAVASLASFSFTLLVNKNVKAQTFEEFVRLSKESNLTLANAGNGSTTHLAGEIIKKSANLKLTNVPYRGSPRLWPTCWGDGSTR